MIPMMPKCSINVAPFLEVFVKALLFKVLKVLNQETKLNTFPVLSKNVTLQGVYIRAPCMVRVSWYYNAATT